MMSYVGRKTCGCIVAAIIDDPDHRKEVAKEIAAWIKDGLTVERVTNDYVREHFRRCN